MHLGLQRPAACALPRRGPQPRGDRPKRSMQALKVEKELGTGSGPTESRTWAEDVKTTSQAAKGLARSQAPGMAPRGAIGRVLTASRPTYLSAAAKTGSQPVQKVLGVLGARTAPGIELGNKASPTLFACIESKSSTTEAKTSARQVESSKDELKRNEDLYTEA